MKKLILVLLTVLALTSCSTDREMRETFRDGKPRMFTDVVTSKLYIIDHKIGDSYTVKPLAIAGDE